jgi:UDP-glucose 4-epimerase
MRCLLTGGAGFIGSHLAEELLKRGNEICVIDDLSTGQIRNIQHLKDKPSFRYVIDSVMNRSVMAELVDESDIVFHLAAAVGVQLVVESPVRTIETNIKGTEIVLELAAKKKKRVVIFSTSEVYGKSDQAAFSEGDDLVLGPTYRGRWSYAASKILDECLALAYHREKKLPVTVIRLFNTVGPRQTGRYGMVVPRFVRQALNGDPISVYGDGSQTRTFTHVNDAVRAIVELAESHDAIGEVFNVGGRECISIRALAELVKRLLESSSSIVYVPYEQAYEHGFEDMERRVPDISKIQQLIRFEPKWSLEQMILDVADYQKKSTPAATHAGNATGR